MENNLLLSMQHMTSTEVYTSHNVKFVQEGRGALYGPFKGLGGCPVPCSRVEEKKRLVTNKMSERTRIGEELQAEDYAAKVHCICIPLHSGFLYQSPVVLPSHLKHEILCSLCGTRLYRLLCTRPYSRSSLSPNRLRIQILLHTVP